MRTSGPSSHRTLDETRRVFLERETPDTPLTATEVADALDCDRPTAASNLDALAEQGELQTKTIGGDHRVWWRSTAQSQVGHSEVASTIEHAQFD